MLDVNNPCTRSKHFDVTCEHLHDGVALFTCVQCGHQDLAYTRPNTGNHPDHPPVPGGYRGVHHAPPGQQVINPGLATEAVIDVPAELEGRE
jgi:hypothetical protein